MISLCVWCGVTGPFLSEELLASSLLFVAGVMITVSIKELVPQALSDSKMHGCAGILIGAIMVKLGLMALNE